MEQSKLEFFIQSKGKFFPAEKIYTIRETLEKLDDSKANLLNIIKFKSTTTIVLFALFLGGLGVDRFATGSTGIGILKIVAMIIAQIIGIVASEDGDLAFLFIFSFAIWIWFIVEIFTASKRAKEYNYQKFIEVVGQYR